MKPSRQITVDPVNDGTDIICTAPIQIDPFRLELVSFLLVPAFAVSSRRLFVKITYGQARIVWNWNSTTAIIPGTIVDFYFQASPGQSFDYQNPSTVDKCVVAPLPTGLVLDSQAKIEFGIRGADAGDVISQAGIMINVRY